MEAGEVAVHGRQAEASIRLLAARHLGIIGLLLAGAALRWAAVAAYRPALWYHADSEAYIGLSQHGLPLDQYRPVGYVLLLKLFRPTGTLEAVVVSQHLLGLAVAVAVYLLLQRRGVSRWLSCLAAAPLIFDSLQVTMEHLVLSETVLTALLAAAVVTLLWPPAPGIVACAASGLLLALAWITKPLALPATAVLLAYLLMRGAGRRRLAAFALAFFLPVLAIRVWVDDRPSPYGSNSTALYGRAASVADCAQPALAAVLTPAERELCPAPDQRGQRPDWYIWVEGAPGYPHRLGTDAYPTMRSFATKVVATQPVAYLSTVGKEVAAHFVPAVALGPGYACLRERYSLPATARDPRPLGLHCHPELAQAGFGPRPAHWATNPPSTALSRALADYSEAARTSKIVFAAAIGLALAALVRQRGVRPRGERPRGERPRAERPRGGRRNVCDAGMLAAVTAALIIPPVLIGMHEPRYAVPAQPIAALAAALALHSLLLARRSRIIRHNAERQVQEPDQARQPGRALQPVRRGRLRRGSVVSGPASRSRAPR